MRVEWAHRAPLVRRRAVGDKSVMQGVARLAGWAVRTALDFALPPRCPACLDVIEQVDRFCGQCWARLQWLSGGCATCGIPLEATDAEQCAACLAKPPPIARTRSAVAYDPLSRGLALRLKYGRKVALARTLAHYMAPLAGEWDGPVLVVPVPLHRRRLWWRGFNQAALIAGHLARRWGTPADHRVLARIRPTRPLKGLSHDQRQRTVRGAFAVCAPERVAGRTIVLVDDVLTSGATSAACARALKRAGARRVELVSWARVVRPAHFVR